MKHFLTGFYCLVGQMCLAQSDSLNIDSVDRFEYKIEHIQLSKLVTSDLSPTRCAQIHNVRVTGTADVFNQLADLLNARGKEGWELISLEQSKTEIVKPHSQQCHYVELMAKALFKRKIYNAGNELDKKVVYHVRLHSQAIRTELMRLINETTWTELGKNFKPELVNEILKKVAEMLEASQIKIIESFQNNN